MAISNNNTISLSLSSILKLNEVISALADCGVTVGEVERRSCYDRPRAGVASFSFEFEVYVKDGARARGLNRAEARASFEALHGLSGETGPIVLEATLWKGWTENDARAWFDREHPEWGVAFKA